MADIGEPVEGTDWHVVYIGDKWWRVTRADGTTFDTDWAADNAWSAFGRYLLALWEEEQEEEV